MKLSLLDIVTDILNDMDGDEVNSIDDTIESQQVAQIVKSAYFAMISNRNWPHLKRTITLDASTNPAQPTKMTLTQDVTELTFINYDVRKSGSDGMCFRPMVWAEPDDFLRVLNGRKSGSDNVDTVIDDNGITLLIQNNKPPQYFTSFNDTDVVFDSYDKNVDNTLQSSKVQAQAYVQPVWQHVDDFIPDLPADAFIALQEEAKSRAMFKLKQMTDIKAEAEAQKQHTWLSRKDWKVKGGIKYPNYGRRGKK